MTLHAPAHTRHTQYFPDCILRWDRWHRWKQIVSGGYQGKVHGSAGFWGSVALFDTPGGVTPCGPSTCTSSSTPTRTHNPLRLTCDSGGPSQALSSELHFASIQTTINGVLSLLKINDSPNNASALLLSLHS